MNWLSRLLGKSKSDPSRPAPVAPDSESDARRPRPAPDAAPSSPGAERTVETAPEAERPLAARPHTAPSQETTDAAERFEADDDPPEDTEDAEDTDERDPTIGRYDPLDETTLGDADLQAMRLQAERLALSGPHKVGPADSAGPGSLLEALMRLEGEGLVVSRVCDDPETGFYVLYQPGPRQP